MIKYDKHVREKGNTQMEQLHLVLKEMLRVIDEICKENNIKYWLTGGTLLGAIRHKGFIPWDDDADIAMERSDYERFAQLASKNLPDGLFFQHGNIDAKKCKWIKIRDNYSTFIQTSTKKVENFHQGIFIDITPYDYTHKDFTKTKMFINRNYKASSNKYIRQFRWFFNILSIAPIKTIGIKRLTKHFLKKYSKKEAMYISTGIDIPHFYYNFKPSVVFPISTVDFDGLKLSAPNDPHLYLEGMFGDYMALPPAEEQVGKHIYNVLPFTKCKHPSAQDY